MIASLEVVSGLKASPGSIHFFAFENHFLLHGLPSSRRPVLASHTEGFSASNKRELAPVHR